jgi:hypothetical protein
MNFNRVTKWLAVRDKVKRRHALTQLALELDLAIYSIEHCKDIAISFPKAIRKIRHVSKALKRSFRKVKE